MADLEIIMYMDRTLFLGINKPAIRVYLKESVAKLPRIVSHSGPKTKLVVTRAPCKEYNVTLGF